MEVDIKEVYRYMGVVGGKGRVEPDGDMEEMILSCIEKMKSQAEPRMVSRRFPVDLREDGPVIGDMETGSLDLKKNLAGCSEAFLMAVTIGPGPDRLIKRAGVASMAQSLIYQAVGAAMVEAVADEENDRLKAVAAGENKSLRPRFSPGYGDFALSNQLKFMEMLDMRKTVGISLTESLIMIPSKSVTAVVGILG